MTTSLMETIKQKLPKYFWVHITNDFIINDVNEIRMVQARLPCNFIPIARENYHRVAEFREEGRISQYRDKLDQKEIGYFAEYNGKMISSFWAIVNRAPITAVVKGYYKVGPNEAFLLDLVTGEQSRGMSVGPFLLSQTVNALFREYAVSRVVFDISVRNRTSMRMIDKLGLRIDHKTLAVSVFSRLVFHLVFRRYAPKPGS
jgi:RimJ/RimL family protein N-acetyltransferase